ncbi:MAG: sigma-54 dependent transcriptional regulator [Chloroherpetonaceae bacterium]|nr:sigma-54 dependent transcriptional regulator [Chloroherpetonaceae bacterium]MDW8438030.1 sigma-54 dependent transcriptional regulator [Chloroherpetonaceae bacterium]
MHTILVVDDEPVLVDFVKEALSSEGYHIETALNGAQAIETARKIFPDIALLDYYLPDINGVEVLKKLRENDEGVQVLMLTGFNDVPTAFEAMRNGAADYILKPFDIGMLKLCIAKVAEKISLRNQIRLLSKETARRYGESEFILCPSPKMMKVYELAAQVAQTNDTTALILGESGSGKEHVAKFIHHSSARKSKPFVELNCAAIPENLLEAELFGYEPGAFTDARSKKIGLFEYADGGTLFLDEIGDMPLSTQAKILRAIETKTFRRVGGLRDLKSDVRIIAATNKDLALAIEEGKFREDLYYRLQVVPIEVPPLRERPEDVLQLADFFLTNFCQTMRKRLELSEEAYEALLGYHWKGNARELKNVMERAVIVAPNGEKIRPEHLALGVRRKRVEAPPPAPAFKEPLMKEEREPALEANFCLREYLENIERKLILEALQRTDGNQLRAAKLLGIERHVLRYQMKKLGIQVKGEHAE